MMMPNSQEARRRADDLQGRLQKRMEQLELESQISALPPVILGGLVVVPLGLLAKITGQPVSTVKDTVDRLAVAARARMVEFIDAGSHRIHYLRCPFQREPDFHVTSVNYSFPELLARAESPR
jgi:hypothetical protein